MKKLLVILALSLAANAAFLVTTFVRPATPSRPSEPGAQAAPATATAFRDASGTGLSPADAGALQRTGELIMAGDLRGLVARLRAAGYPPFIIRAIVSAQLTEQFGVRRKAVVARQEVVPYWKSSQSFPPDAKAGGELAALSREQAALLKDLLGPDAAPSDEWSRLIRERQYGNLPQEKIDRLQGILSDYNDLRAQINADTKGIMLPEDRQKYALLEKEQRADIAKLFTPEELEAYDLRTSNTANRLRFQLAGFNPTEEEFRKIHDLSRDTESQVAALEQTAMETGNSRAMAEAQGLQAQLSAQIAAALGAARAADYQQAIDPNYQQVNRLLTRLDLPTSLAPQVVSVQQDIQPRANAIRQDRSLSTDERSSRLAVLAQEAQTRLTSTLGERGFQAYKGFGGWWLNNLTPRTAQPLPAFQFGNPPKP